MTPTERRDWKQEILGRGHRPGWTRFRKTYRTYKVPGAQKHSDPKFMGRIVRSNLKRDLWNAEVWEHTNRTDLGAWSPGTYSWVKKGSGTHDDMMRLVEGFAVEQVIDREDVA